MKKLLSLLIVLIMSVTAMCLPVSAEPLTVIDSREWSGMMPGTCRFVTKNTSMTKISNVESDEMMVVTDGSNLKIKGKLTVKGTLIIHYGAQVTVMDGGQLILTKPAIVVANGTVAVSRGGKLRNYGYLQSSGRTAVKGVLKTYKTGTFTYYTEPEIYQSGEVIGSSTEITGAPLYYTEDYQYLVGRELEAFSEFTGESRTISAEDSKSVVWAAEAVLYKYDKTLYSPTPLDGDTEIDDYLYHQEYMVEPKNRDPGLYPAFYVYDDGSLVLLTRSAKNGSATADIYNTIRGSQKTSYYDF